MIGGIGFDITVNDHGERRRIFGFELRYNYGISSLYQTDKYLGADAYKLRDNTLAILLNIYFPSISNIVNDEYDSRVY